jgi:hypothetical protein
VIIQMPHYEIFRHNSKRWARLLADKSYQTPITGHKIHFSNGRFSCCLMPDGLLTIFAMSEWDLGTMAIDDPAMVYASLPHDAGCHMTDSGVLPWSCRMQFDKYLWTCLTQAGAKVSRLWRTPAVMINSQLIARWSRTK